MWPNKQIQQRESVTGDSQPVSFMGQKRTGQTSGVSGRSVFEQGWAFQQQASTTVCVWLAEAKLSVNLCCREGFFPFLLLCAKHNSCTDGSQVGRQFRHSNKCGVGPRTSPSEDVLALMEHAERGDGTPTCREPRKCVAVKEGRGKKKNPNRMQITTSLPSVILECEQMIAS